MKMLRFLVPLLAILLSGCLNLDETLTIRESGSADLSVIYAISEQAVAQMKAILRVRDQMSALTAESSPSQDRLLELFLNPVEDQIRREIKKYEKFGITVERLKVDARDGWRHVELKVSCRNMADLSKTDFFPQYGFSLSRASDGNYTFFRDRENQNEALAGSIADPATLSLMTPVIEGFRTIFRINTPGRILQTNAHVKSLRNASWEFNFDKNPNAITALQNQQFKIVFDGKGTDGRNFSLPEVVQSRTASPKAK